MVFRFANGIFEPVWNRRYIDHVQITVAESGRRRGPRRLLRDGRRAARHGAEPPVPAAGADRDGAAQLVRAGSRPRRAGQGAARDPAVHAGAGRAATSCAASTWPGRWTASRPSATARSRPSRPTSATETYVALKLLIDNWRWADVPFYLRTGKRLARRVSEIAIRFKSPPLLLFRDAACAEQVVAQHADRAHPAGRGHRAALPGQGARARISASAWSAWSSSTPTTSAPSRRPATRRCSTTDDRRPDAVPPRRHGRDRVGGGGADPRRTGRGRRTASSTYSASSWGPPSAQALLARDGREWRTP